MSTIEAQPTATFSPLDQTALDLADLGRQLDTDGFVGAELTVRRLVREARELGLSSPALDVLADTEAPEVVRLRAFAMVSMRVFGRRSRRASRCDRRVA